ncbi:hypothetical protein G6045_16645 [Streptomyces sp. YC504]|uniref:HEAT repeat domain-containing protein n=1 Tax=Streptomyces mesophilus TaxID=1775132 RepID=A0A6G4XKP0_9ACTN|nr:hypothetical protein [Streptomyces mesophilus]NGO77274.1 hypothetical protein [Streptomyces mesophilus]
MRADSSEGVAAALRLVQGAPLGEALDTTDPEAWVSLDVGVRELRGPQRLLLPTRAELAGQRFSWEPDATLPTVRLRAKELVDTRLALALCHPDGRVREASIREAAGRPQLLPLIVVRATDWAAPVRERARAALRTALPLLDRAQLTGLAPVILRVAGRERADFGTELLRRTLREAPQDRLEPRLAHPDRDVRRFAYRFAIAEQRLSPAELSRAAMRDSDVVVQHVCADAALAAVPVDTYDAALDPLLEARNPRVRAAGVTALRRSGQAERAVPFLADRAPVVRACARYVVRQLGVEPRPRYLAWCAAGDEMPPGAPIGLAECGDRTDADVLWALTGHSVARIRASAVAGLRALDSVHSASADRLLPLLDDPAPGVAREVAATLAAAPVAVPSAWLLARLGADRPRHIRVAAFRLLDRQGGLPQLRAAVSLLDDPDPKLRHWAGLSVQRWERPVGLPRGDAEVAALYERCAHLFSPYVLKRRKWAAGIGA